MEGWLKNIYKGGFTVENAFIIVEALVIYAVGVQFGKLLGRRFIK